MLDQCKTYLNTMSPRLVSIGSLLFGLMIFYIDRATGYEIHVSVFYLIPTFMVTWYVGLESGLVYGVLASVAWTAAESSPDSNIRISESSFGTRSSEPGSS